MIPAEIIKRLGGYKHYAFVLRKASGVIHAQFTKPLRKRGIYSEHELLRLEFDLQQMQSNVRHEHSEFLVVTGAQLIATNPVIEFENAPTLDSILATLRAMQFQYVAVVEDADGKSALYEEWKPS